MNKLVKIALGLAVLFAGLLVAAVLLVKVLVTPERIKEIVLPLAEQKLQRRISLGEVKVGIFSGIELHDLAVSDPGEAESFVVAERAVLRFQLLPLLSRRVVVDEVSLERPLIRVIRRADGSFNFDDLLPGRSAAPADVAGPPAVAEGGPPVSVLVTVARVQDGRLAFIDRQAGATTELSELQFDATGITLDGTIPITLTARIQGAPFRVEGVVRPLQKGGSFRVDLQGLDAVAFAPYYHGTIPGKLSRLLLDLQGEFILQGRAVTARGVVQGRELDLSLLTLPTAPLQNAQVKVDYDVAFDPERDRLDIAAATVTVNGLAVRLSGDISGLAAAPRGSLELVIPGLDLALLGKMLPPDLPGGLGLLAPSGTLRGAASLEGPVDRPLEMLRSGELTLDKVQVTAAGVRPTIAGRITQAGDTARIEALTVSLGELVATLTGRVDRLFAAPAADLAVTLPRVDLARALAAAPQDALKGAAALAPAGELEARARLTGPLAKPEALLQSAEITLAGVQVTAAGLRPAFDGRLRLSGDRLTSEGLTMRLGGNTARLALTARNLFGKPVIATADLDADRFQLEPLLQGSATAASPAPAAKAEQPAAGKPLDLLLQASGTIRIGETAWHGLTINELLAEYALRDNQLTIARMTGRVAGGSFRNSGRIDLRRPEPDFAASLALQGIQADPLLTALAPRAAGTLFGALQLQATVSGSGLAWETISRSLSGEGTLALADGRLVSPALVQGFATFLQLPGLDAIAFSDFQGKTRIVDGMAQVDCRLLGRQLRLFPKGTLGLDGSLNLATDTRLSPELAARIDQRGKVTRYLLDADGWSQVPLLVSGTLTAPRFGLDPKGVQAQATKALQQEVQRGLDKLLGTPQPPPTPAGEPAPAQPEAPPAGQEEQPAPQEALPPAPSQTPATPAQKLLEESLKRVLGR